VQKIVTRPLRGVREGRFQWFFEEEIPVELHVVDYRLPSFWYFALRLASALSRLHVGVPGAAMAGRFAGFINILAGRRRLVLLESLGEN
jgi:hypothetical protein